jgi:hypothetical protein
MSAEDVGVATGILVFFRNLGSVFGVAIGSTIFSNQFDKHIRDISLPSTLRSLNSNNAVEIIPALRTMDLPDELKDQILKAYGLSFRMVWLVMACVGGIGLASSLLMKELTLEREDMGQQAFRARAHRDMEGSTLREEDEEEGIYVGSVAAFAPKLLSLPSEVFDPIIICVWGVTVGRGLRSAHSETSLSGDTIESC